MNFIQFKFICIPIQNNWGNLTDFSIMIISLFNLLLFFYLTRQIHKYNKLKDNLDNMPIISFQVRDKGNYIVENVGMRTAIDVKLYKDFNEKDLVNLKPKKLYAIGSNQFYETDFNDATQLLATYNGIDGTKYFSYMDGSLLRYSDVKSAENKFRDDWDKIKIILE